MTEKSNVKWIAGFWRRIAAFVIDTLLLGLGGFLLGQGFESVFVEMGGWGRFVGFGIALIYFGAMNSKLFDGQTIGKKILKVRVVNYNHETITVGRSIFRYIVLALPFLLNGNQIFSSEMLSILAYPLSLTIFGGILSIIYLFIFNRVNRQSLHDLAVGTYVVDAEAEKQEVGSVWKVHLVVVALLFIVASLAPAFTKDLAKSDLFKEMFTVQTALSNEVEVRHSRIFDGTSTMSTQKNDTKTIKFFSAAIFLNSKKTEDSDFAKRLALVIAENYSEITQKDTLRVTLIYGYDIGIWARWHRRAYNFLPSELVDSE